VTLRATDGLPSLREDVPFEAIKRALSAASKPAFRLLHFSVQRDHIHLLVEADTSVALSRGIQGLAIRAAKAINRALRRHGRVWASRFHVRDLQTPREVRHALLYVLNNLKKHVPTARGLDPCSSSAWFWGWKRPVAQSPGASPVAAPRTWLARVGWQRHGRLDLDEPPRARAGPRARGPMKRWTAARAHAPSVHRAGRRRHLRCVDAGA
jgi:REP element-mobilizing transposase RayT